MSTGLYEAAYLHVDQGNMINGCKALDSLHAGSLDIQHHIADLGSCIPHRQTPPVFMSP